MPPFDAVFETIATMMDRAFTPEGGGNSEAGKAVIRRITQAAREQFELKVGTTAGDSEMIQVSNLYFLA